MSNKMIRDLDLAIQFDLLFEKPVYYYGIGHEGRRMLEFTKKIGIIPQGVCDSNSALRGSNITGIPVYTLDQLLDIAINEDIIIIVTSTAYRESIIKMLQDNNIQCENIYTLFALFYAIYFNRKNVRLSEKKQKYLCDLLELWLYNEGVKLHAKQAECTLFPLMMKELETVPIIVYQPGKVGSNAVFKSLKAVGVDVVRSHGIAYTCRTESVEFKENILNKIRDFNKVKIITIVREPIAKDIGHFFQKIALEERDMGWLIKGIMEEDFQKSFLNYLSVVTPLDFSSKKSGYDEKIISHIDYINTITNQGAYWGWFEEELKNNLGIDILESPFDVEKGYSIICKDNIEVLVLKLEKLNELESVLGEFVGKDIVPILRDNCAKQKSYRYAYKQFYEEILLPQEYIDFYYKDNPYVNHFYSKEEKELYYSRWISKVIDNK